MHARWQDGRARITAFLACCFSLRPWSLALLARFDTQDHKKEKKRKRGGKKEEDKKERKRGYSSWGTTGAEIKSCRGGERSGRKRIFYEIKKKRVNKREKATRDHCPNLWMDRSMHLFSSGLSRYSFGPFFSSTFQLCVLWYDFQIHIRVDALGLCDTMCSWKQSTEIKGCPDVTSPTRLSLCVLCVYVAAVAYLWSRLLSSCTHFSLLPRHAHVLHVDIVLVLCLCPSTELAMLFCAPCLFCLFCLFLFLPRLCWPFRHVSLHRK